MATCHCSTTAMRNGELTRGFTWLPAHRPVTNLIKKSCTAEVMESSRSLTASYVAVGNIVVSESLFIAVFRLFIIASLQKVDLGGFKELCEDLW